MTNNILQKENKKERETTGISRRNFLRYASASSAIVMLGAACSKDDNNTPKNNNNSGGGTNLGSGDVGILNYAYALEQLEAAFYMRAVHNLYSGISSDEQALLTDIRDHEVAHRQFFKTALGANAIVDLEVDFSSIDFSSRTSVLATAKAFEDLGVSAYNGAGSLITSPDYLTLAGKIVSVEARHAAWIRDRISPGTFAGSDVIDANGLEMSKPPRQVLAIAKTYIKTKLDASNLPS